MKNKNTLYLILAIGILSSCGSDSEPVQPTTFYKKENVVSKQLALSI